MKSFDSEFPNYFIDDNGNVWSSHRNKFTKLRGAISTSGYIQIVLWNKGKRRLRYLHRLVCELFHGPCPHNKEAAHLDGNRYNNHPSNLKWVTPQENSDHKYKHGTMARGERIGTSKLTEDEVINIILDHRSGSKTRKEIASEYGISKNHVSDIANGRRWKHLEV